MSEEDPKEVAKKERKTPQVERLLLAVSEDRMDPAVQRVRTRKGGTASSATSASPAMASAPSPGAAKCVGVRRDRERRPPRLGPRLLQRD